MKHYKWIFLFFLTASLTAVSICGKKLEAGVLAKDVDFNLTTDIYSKYIWRGQNLGDDTVTQSGLSAAYKDITASVWANYDTGAGDEWTECDYTLDYTVPLGFLDKKLEKLSASVGYTYYTFPNLDTDETSQEVYLGIALDVLLSPAFTFYYDFDTGDGTYLEGAISHTFEFNSFSISPSVTVGYNSGQWGYDSSWSSALFGLNVSVPLGEYCTAGLTAAESAALDSQYENEFYWGLNLSVNF